jgi:very-short-patch-repair endonuclease
VSQQAPRRRPAAQEATESLKMAHGASVGDFGGYASELEAVLANRIAKAGLPAPAVQYRFCPTRRWRADFAYPDAMLLIEADGGTWSGGRHVRGKGFEADCEKTSTAAALGYRVIRVTREMIEDGRAVRLIAQALEAD